MGTEAHTKKAAVGATLIFAIVAMFTMAAGTSSASAQTLTLQSGQIGIGSINVSWSGSESVDDGHLTANDWIVTGGDPDTPLVDVLADIDDFTAGTHIVLSLVAVALANSSCVVTFHGPLLVDNLGGDTYGGAFTKAQLGGILYSNCNIFEQALILGTISSGGGVSVLFDIGH